MAVKYRQRRRRYRQIMRDGRIILIPIKDEVSITRYWDARTRLFGRYFGPEITAWSTENNVAYYHPSTQKAIAQRKRDIKILIKYYNRTFDEAVAELDSEMYEKARLMYINEVAPELEYLDISSWPREDLERFEEEYAYNVYKVGSP